MTESTPDAPARPTRAVQGSSGPLTAGVGGFLLAALLIPLGVASEVPLLTIVGAICGLVAAVFLVIGVYQLAENVDRAARAAVERD